MSLAASSHATDDPAVVSREFIDPSPPYPFSHTATLVETEPGRFIAAWIGGPGNRAPENNVWMANWDGKAWAKPVEVTDDKIANFNPVLVKDSQRGEILFNYKLGNSPENWTAAVRRSTDNGRTWGPVELLPAGMTGIVRNNPVVAPDGTWICGDSVETYAAWSCWINRTADGGRTWKRFGPVFLPEHPKGIIQPVMFYADAARSRLVMLTRTPAEIGRLCIADSTDQGMTWSVPRPADALPNPNSAVDAVRISDGRIVLVHNDDAASKSRLVVSISKDGGATWTKSATIMDEREGEYIYPYMIEDSRGMLQIVYSWNKERIERVVIDPARLK